MTSSALSDQGQRNVLAIIPARMGSKGIFRKNLADLGGKPLIAHSILAARQCILINRVIVSTDSEDIAAVSRHWGAEVPFLRPAELSHDDASLGDVIDHTLESLKHEQGYAPEVVITLCPTHPFRANWLMTELTTKLLGGYRNVRTVRRIPAHEFSHFVEGPNQSLRPMAGSEPLRTRFLFRSYGLFVGARCQGECAFELYLHQLQTEPELLDIDEPHHLARANELMDGWDPEQAIAPAGRVEPEGALPEAIPAW